MWAPAEPVTSSAAEAREHYFQHLAGTGYQTPDSPTIGDYASHGQTQIEWIGPDDGVSFVVRVRELAGVKSGWIGGEPHALRAMMSLAA